MTRDEIRREIEESLRIVLSLDGRSAGVISDETDPIDQLGLDSMDGVAVATELTCKLGIPIPNKVNPLVIRDAGKKRPRKVSEIVDLMVSLTKKKSR